MVIDPISDMLTRIRNALTANHKTVDVPSSKFKLEIARILVEEGFIVSFDKTTKNKFKYIKIRLKYSADNRTSVIKELKRISRPGLRVYVNKSEIPRVLGGLGMSIISTSKGIMTGSKAREVGVGGEILCSII